MAEKELDIRIKAAVESAEAAKSLGQLKRALLDIQELQSEVGDTSGENFDRLAQASAAASQQLAGTRDAIGDIADRTRTLEGTPVERLSGSFGLLKESILNLDFDKAKIAFEGFNTLASGALENLKGGAKGLFGSFKEGFSALASNPLGALQSGFTSLGSGIKNLGTTFVNLGKALLTNPIFLLATVITVIVIAVIKLLDSLGLLKPIMDGIKAAIGAVIDAFKALTDWLGLTDNAGEEASKNQKKQTDERVKNAEKQAKSQEDLYNLTKDLTDDEIKLLEERLGVEIDTSKSIYDIKQQEAQEKADAYAEEIAQLEGRRSLSDEDKKRLEEVRVKYQEENANIVKSEQDKQAAILKGARNADSILQNLRAKSIENENQRSKAFLDIAEKEAIAKLEQAKREAKQLGDDATVKKLEEAITLTKADFAKQRKKIDDDANKAAADARQKAATDALNSAKGEAAKGLKAIQDAEAAKVAKTEEGTKARLDAELAAITAIEAYQKKNAKMLGLTQDQLTVIYEANIDKRTKLQEDFDKKVLDAANKEKQVQAEIALLKAEAIVNEDERNKKRIEASIKLAEAERDIALSDTELTENEKEKIKLEAANKIMALNKEMTDMEIANNQKILEDAALVSETKLSQAQFDADRTKGTLEQEMAEVDNIKNLRLEALEAQKQAELSATDLTEAQKKEIEERYRQEKLTAEEEATAQIKALRQQELDKTLEVAQKGFSAGQALSDAVFAIKKRKLEKGSEEELKAAKKQFAVNKALQLGMAVIDGVKAIQSSLAQSPIAIGPVPNPAGIASLAFAAITSAANIAKIAASKFEGGEKPTAPPTPDLGGGGAGGGETSAASSFSPTQFFGLGQGAASSGGAGGGAMKVFVTETDITSTQNKVRVIEDRAVIK